VILGEGQDKKDKYVIHFFLVFKIPNDIQDECRFWLFQPFITYGSWTWPSCSWLRSRNSSTRFDTIFVAFSCSASCNHFSVVFKCSPV